MNIRTIFFCLFIFSFMLSDRIKAQENPNETPDYKIGDAVYFNPYTGQQCDPQTAWTKDNPSGQCFKWNVLQNNDETLDLISDHNLGPKTAWIDERDFISAGGTKEEYGTRGNNKYGPLTALKELKNVSKDFQNVETLTTQDNVTRKNAAGSEYTINYNGYKARLAGAQELADMVKNKPTEDGTIWNASTYSFIHAMPVWLYANLGRPTPSADSLFIPTRPIPRTTAPYG